MERNVCDLYYLNKKGHGINVSVSYRKSTAELYQPRYYEVIIWSRDGKERGYIVYMDSLGAINDKEAYKEAYILAMEHIM